MKHSNKEPATINFETSILERIDYKAKKEKRNRSDIVNSLLSPILMTDEEYYRTMAIQANQELQKYLFLAEQAKTIKEMK